MPTMLNAILHVLLLRTPSQVYKSVICVVTIEMTADRPTWTGSNVGL